MTEGFELRLWEDRLDAHASAASPPGPANRIVYVVEGEAAAAGGEAAAAGQPLAANAARHVAGPLALRAGAAGARLWRWELIAGPRESALVPAGVSRLVFVQPLTLDG